MSMDGVSSFKIFEWKKSFVDIAQAQSCDTGYLPGNDVCCDGIIYIWILLMYIDI